MACFAVRILPFSSTFVGLLQKFAAFERERENFASKRRVLGFLLLVGSLSRIFVFVCVLSVLNLHEQKGEKKHTQTLNPTKTKLK